MDAQSRAFREAKPEDRVPDEQLAEHAEARHEPIQGHADVKLPDEYEAENWDAERVAPKSLDEARDALAARIANPTAPDGGEVVGAYDGLT